jgi:predicted nucleic acid-binding protein
MEREGTTYSDDFDARSYAQRHGFFVSGTLGVLALLIKGEHLTSAEADAYLQQMIAHGYYSPVTSITQLNNI